MRITGRILFDPGFIAGLMGGEDNRTIELLPNQWATQVSYLPCRGDLLWLQEGYVEYHVKRSTLSEIVYGTILTVRRPEHFKHRECHVRVVPAEKMQLKSSRLTLEVIKVSDDNRLTCIVHKENAREVLRRASK